VLETSCEALKVDVTVGDVKADGAALLRGAADRTMIDSRERGEEWSGP
jgi:hypothetical protein